MKSVALYARVSSEQQAQRATIESQLAELRERVETDGHRLLPGDVYADDGCSGASLVRPALEKLRDRVAEGGLDLLYVHAPDRLARRYAYQVILLDELAGHGTEVLFLHGPSGQSAEDELLVQVQGVIAEYEHAKIVERCRRGKLHRARQGSVNVLSGAPYGYLYVRKSDTEPARYEILLQEAKIVRQIFDSYVHGQISIGAIVRDLNVRAVATRRGASRWDRSTVWGVLRNPAYKGKAAFGKTETIQRRKLLRPLRGKPSVPRRPKSTSRDKPSDEWITIDVPAIVSAETFDGAAAQLERNKRLSRRNGRGNRYLLQGLTVCAQCGYAFYGKTVSRTSAKGRQRWGYYRCTGTDGYRFAGGRVCSNKQVRVDQLDGFVWDNVCTLLQDPKRLVDEWTRRGSADGLNAQLREQRDNAIRTWKTQERALQRLVDAYEVGALTLDELQERSPRVRKRIERARTVVAEAESRFSEHVELTALVSRIEDFATRVRDGLTDLPWDERQRVTRALVARVEIDLEGATIVYRVPGQTTPPDASPTGGQENGRGGSDKKSCQLHGRRVNPSLGGTDVSTPNGALLQFPSKWVRAPGTPFPPQGPFGMGSPASTVL